MIEHDDVGDDAIDGALLVGDLALAHAVADHLAAAEFHLVAVDGEILLDFEDEIGVGEPQAVAFGRAEHVGIGGAGEGCHASTGTGAKPCSSAASASNVNVVSAPAAALSAWIKQSAKSAWDS